MADAGLPFFSAHDEEVQVERPDTLVTLQTIEHVIDPLAWLKTQLDRLIGQE